jgi:N-acetylglutamate synthase-like GNAT family acetyltransferase
MNIRSARSEDATIITALSLRSKAHWGYDDNFMQDCEEELSHSVEDLFDKNRHYALVEIDNQIAGFYTLEDIHNAKIDLLTLFIDPNSMNCGLGRLLFNDACKVAKSMGADLLEVQSDPYAEAFYQKMGAMTVGRLESDSIKDRFLPLMQFKLT